MHESSGKVWVTTLTPLPPRSLMPCELTCSDWHLQLISLYCWVDDGFRERGWDALCQRFSHNASPAFTDAEVMAVYLFARLRGHHTLKAARTFVSDFAAEFFPLLPGSSAFVDRVHRVLPAVLRTLEELVGSLEFRSKADWVLDSCPVVMAQGPRARRAKVAPDVASLGYCASKDTWYHGLKLHVLARRRPGRMPEPVALGLSAANEYARHKGARSTERRPRSRGALRRPCLQERGAGRAVGRPRVHPPHPTQADERALPLRGPGRVEPRRAPRSPANRGLLRLASGEDRVPACLPAAFDEGGSAVRVDLVAAGNALAFFSLNNSGLAYPI